MGYDPDYYFDKLREALKKNRIFQSSVSFGCFDDDSICIEQEANIWIVYSVDRGNKLRKKEFNSIEDACYDVIHRATSNAEEEKNTKYYFSKSLEPVKLEPDRKIKYPRIKSISMKKRELIHALASRTYMTRKESEVALNGILDVISTSMAKGEKVQIKGFGTFEAKSRPARVARNPRTGASVKVAASKTPAFKAGKALKNSINTASAKTVKAKTTKVAKTNSAKAIAKKKTR